MLEQLYVKSQPCPMTKIDPSVMLLVPSSSVKDGSFVRDTEYKPVCVEDSFKQFSVFDFEIANILEIGATNLLKPVTMSNHDVDSIVQQVDTIANGVDTAIAEQAKSE